MQAVFSATVRRSPATAIFGREPAHIRSEMTAATSKRGKMAAVVAILLALVVMNAADLCAAATPAPVHPCCPASQQKTTNHCAKLGCFMSDPILQSKLQTVDPPAIETLPLVSAAEYFFPVPMNFAEAPLPICDRSVCFHQLLI